MERFEATVPPTYFRNARAVIFVYAVNNQESIDNIIHWTESVSYQRLGDMSQTLIRALVANKIDLEDERIVEKERGLNTAERCEIDKEMYFEVSAKSGEGVDEMFNPKVSETEGLGETPPKKYNRNAHKYKSFTGSTHVQQGYIQ